jgi:glutamine---fructose-6-phosphate transaminase (isomerizing)
MNYLDNILEQPDCLRQVTQRYKEHALWLDLEKLCHSGDRLILTGLGASFHALYPMRYYLHQQGIPALHLDTGELIHQVPELLQHPGILVVVSQSGESIEILKLLEKLQAHKSLQVISLTNQPGNTLARASAFALHTQVGAEVGVATKTFTSTLAVLHWLGRSLVKPVDRTHYLEVCQAADQMEKVLSRWETWLHPVGEHFETVTTFALVARGASLSSAYNGALVLQEAVRQPATTFAGSQFRHGPMEMLSDQLGIILYHPLGRAQDIMVRMAWDICDRGGKLITVGEKIPELPAVHLDLPNLDEWVSPIVSPIAVQLLAETLAATRGLTPGQFRWSGKVIQQE